MFPVETTMRGDARRPLTLPRSIAFAAGAALLMLLFPRKAPLLLQLLDTVDDAVTTHRSAGWLASAWHFSALACIAGGTALVSTRLLVRRTPSQDDNAMASLRISRGMAIAVSLGIGIVLTWILRTRLGIGPRWLVAKEGGLEILGFAMFVVAAAFCVSAARRLGATTRPLDCVIAAVLGILLFVVAMEEIAWGQTFIGFATPASFETLNHQGELTLHNLLSREPLDQLTRLAALIFGLGVTLSMVLATRIHSDTLQRFAPDVTLAPLALVVAYTGVFVHAEPFETQLALFFCFYGYQLNRNAAQPATPAPAQSDP